MALTRGVVAFAVLVPAAMLGAPGVASAAGPTAEYKYPQAPWLGEDGRYRTHICDHTKQHFCLADRIFPAGWTPGHPIPLAGGGAPTTGMAPADVLAGYKIPSSATTNGKIVAILDSPDSSAFSDLTAYRSAYGLPTIPKCTGNPDGHTTCFAQVNETGGPSSGGDSGQDDGETSLDMDMISAACPDCAILLVELDQLANTDIQTGAQTATTLLASATSISLGGPESGSDPMGYTTPGHLVLAASGDFGYLLVNEQGGGSTPSYPSSAPDIISVGGTALFNNSGTYDEGVWNDGTFSTSSTGQDVTTSGCSTEFPMPSYQTMALTGSGCSKRATADIAAAAAFYVGKTTQYINIYQGSWESVEGTSASSPMVAAILTRVGLTDAISADLSWEYTHASGFNDLGSTAYPVDPNGKKTDAKTASVCGATNALCNALTGWDGPSGVGTPNGTALYALAGSSSGGSSGSSSGGVDAGTDAGVDAGGSGSGSGSGGGSGSGSGSSGGSGSGGGSGGGIEDSGFISPGEGGLVSEDSGLDGTFEAGGSSSVGCGCATPGNSSVPLEDTGMMALVVGAVAVLGARKGRRGRK